MEGASPRPPAQAPFLDLPPDCLYLIMDQLNTVASLQSLILSHSVFHGLFLRRKTLTYRQVWENEINTPPRALVAIAHAIIRAERVQQWGRETYDDTLNFFFDQEMFDEKDLTMEETTWIRDFHRSAVFFTAEFVKNALSEHPLTGKPATVPAFITPAEWHRIIQAFYRFEFYVKVYARKRKWNQRIRLIPSFAKRFAVWELEQICAVGEYLFHQLSTPFNDVAQHDIDWGANHIYPYATELWETGRPDRAKNFWLQGLVFLRQFVTTGTYEKRRQMLVSRLLVENSVELSMATLKDAQRFPMDQFHQHAESFLARHSIYHSPTELDARIISTYDFEGSDVLGDQGFQVYAIDLWSFCENDEELWHNLSEDEQARVTGAPLLPEPNDGPVQAWKWTHYNCMLDHFVGGRECRYLRRRGYVFWGYSRLAEMGFFEDSDGVPSWSGFNGNGTLFERDWDTDDWDEAKVDDTSLTRRKWLREQGAIGWWDRSDESQVQWPSDCFSTDH